MLTGESVHKLAFVSCYAACESWGNDSFIGWNRDLYALLVEEGMALKSQGFAVLAMGDFNSRVGRMPGLPGNTPDVNQNGFIFLDFLETLGLEVLNSHPTNPEIFTWFSDGRRGSSS